MIPLYLLAIISLLVGTAAVYMALIRAVPIQWLYYRHLWGKPLVWMILIGSTAWALWLTPLIRCDRALCVSRILTVCDRW